MSKIKVSDISSSTGDILIEMFDADSKTSASLELDLNQALALIASLTVKINKKRPSGKQPTFVTAKNPAFEVRIDGSGNTILSVMPSPLPPMDFVFDARMLKSLILALQKAAIIPLNASEAKN